MIEEINGARISHIQSTDELSTTSLNAYALFAGAGGFHLGLEQAGISVLVSTDIEPCSESTHKRNWPNRPFLRADIRRISAEQLLDLADGVKPDLIVGGPPCQGFSTLGDKLSSDPRNDLFNAYARLVADLDPKFLLIENVKALVTMYKGQFQQNIIKTFSNLGYTMYRTIVNTADYGVPQIRHRVIFFGTKLGNPFAFPRPTHGIGEELLPYETVNDWIIDLVEAGEEVPNHIALQHSEKVIARYGLIPEGGKLPAPELLPEAIRRSNFGNTYKRLHRDKPSLTLVPGNNAFPIHPVLNRSLTPREAARLQTFPDNFVFDGDRRRQCILVGNAVPPKLAYVLAKSVIAHNDDAVAPQLGNQPVEAVEKMHSLIPVGNQSTPPSSQGFVDLFCGAGGFTIGFGRAGWKPLLDADIHPVVALTHRHNLSAVPFMQGDLADPNVRDQIVSDFQGREVGIVVGGPPCQGFSIFGKRRFVNTRSYDPHIDPRNKLVFAFVDIVKRLSPRWFVMENVPGLASLDNGLFLRVLLEEFHGMGYPNAQVRILNAADYGVPQLRKRLLIIGNRTGHIIPWPKKKFFGHPQDWQDSYRTVGEAIHDLASEESYSRYTCHVPMKHKPLVTERYKFIPEGGKLDIAGLPEHLKSGYRTEEIKNYSHVFKRLHRDRPANTMVPGHNAFPIHPWLDRALTVREAARIQTFPDEMEFKGSRQEQCIQVGNAFPPLLAELIGNSIRKAEVNGWFPDQVPPSAYYALIEKDSVVPEKGSSNGQLLLPLAISSSGGEHYEP